MRQFKTLMAAAFVSFFVFFCIEEDESHGFHGGSKNGAVHEHKTWACEITCMDARCHKFKVVEDWLYKRRKIYYLDPVTEAGPNKILADNPSSGLDKFVVENIKRRLGVSVKYHKAKIVVIVAHEDCAANPAKKEVQIQHLREAAKTVESFNLGLEIILLWLDSTFKNVEEIKR